MQLYFCMAVIQEIVNKITPTSYEHEHVVLGIAKTRKIWSAYHYRLTYTFGT